MTMKFLSSGTRIAFFAVCGFAVSPINVLAEGQLTLVNANAKTAFKTYALKTNEFCYEAGRGHDETDVLTPAIPSAPFICARCLKQRRSYASPVHVLLNGASSEFVQKHGSPSTFSAI